MRHGCLADLLTRGCRGEMAWTRMRCKRLPLRWIFPKAAEIRSMRQRRDAGDASYRGADAASVAGGDEDGGEDSEEADLEATEPM